MIDPKYKVGDDPNIIYPQQITPGTPLMQGPQGPIVSSIRKLADKFSIKIFFVLFFQAST